MTAIAPEHARPDAACSAGSRPPRAAALNEQLRLKIMGYIVSRAIHAAAELDIASKLARGPLTAAELAGLTGAEPGALGRVMDVLTAEGLLAADDRGRYALTELGELLRGDVPGSLRHFSLQMGGEAYLAWSESPHSVRTGQPAFDRTFGTSYFDWLAAHPDTAARFNRLQSDLVVRRLEPLRAIGWPARGLVVDVGAGDGTLLVELLAGQPGLAGIALDLPHVADAARRRVAQAGLSDRIRCAGGDFFREVPGGGDYYILAEILHDWDDEHAVAILRQCRRAMPPHGRLLMLEQVIPDGHKQHPARLLDLHMLVMLGGRERTRGQWHALLDRGGLALESVTVAERSCLLQATPR
jgi:SAM-dependent methyltransferase/DNA-binding transcriptional ArsR family regulator